MQKKIKSEDFHCNLTDRKNNSLNVVLIIHKTSHILQNEKCTCSQNAYSENWSSVAESLYLIHIATQICILVAGFEVAALSPIHEEWRV